MMVFLFSIYKTLKPIIFDLLARELSGISYAPVAQLDRASDYESEGRAFESLRVRSSHPKSIKPNKLRCTLPFLFVYICYFIFR